MYFKHWNCKKLVSVVYGPAQVWEVAPTHLLLPGFLSVCWDMSAWKNKVKSTLCHDVFYKNHSFQRIFVPGSIAHGTLRTRGAWAPDGGRHPSPPWSCSAPSVTPHGLQSSSWCFAWPSWKLSRKGCFSSPRHQVFRFYGCVVWVEVFCLISFVNCWIFVQKVLWDGGGRGGFPLGTRSHCSACLTAVPSLLTLLLIQRVRKPSVSSCSLFSLGPSYYQEWFRVDCRNNFLAVTMYCNLLKRVVELKKNFKSIK